MQAIPSRAIASLGSDFWDPVAAAAFPQHHLRWRNDRAAAEVGLETLDDARWLDHFGRFEPIPGSLETPLALRYHGHQFRHYNPDIGDGRGFVFAQLHGADGRLLDLGTKGSGQTPWSRSGDGRLTLKGAVRELLATEMLEALGVTTSRTFSIVETGEGLTRGDEPSPTRSAVLVRLSHGHIRIGAFQRLAYLDQPANVAKLARYALTRLSSSAGKRRAWERDGSDAEAASALLDWAAANTARLAAQYMAAGFVHGVLNSDNINVTGESFDYGPWRWLPTWDATFTAAYFDHSGLYAYARQPEAISWDLLQLARALTVIAPPDALLPHLQAWPARYEAELRVAMLARLGVLSRGDAEDLAVLQAIEAALTSTQASFDRFWFDWRGLSPARLARYDDPAWTALKRALASYEPVVHAREHAYWSDPAPQSMLIDEVEAIWSAIATDDDWTPLAAKVAAVRRMGEALRPAPHPA